MTQINLPIAGPRHIEVELRERCPAMNINVFTECRNGFDWKIINGWRGSWVIRVERHFWSQARLEFIEKYDAEVKSNAK